MQYYQHLLAEQHTWQMKVDGITFSTLDQQCARWLDRPFEEEEVCKAIHGMASCNDCGPCGMWFTLWFLDGEW